MRMYILPLIIVLVAGCLRGPSEPSEETTTLGVTKTTVEAKELREEFKKKFTTNWDQANALMRSGDPENCSKISELANLIDYGRHGIPEPISNQFDKFEDLCYHNAAVTRREGSYCDKVADEEIRKECFEIVAKLSA